jgi:hypothetical protein
MATPPCDDGCGELPGYLQPMEGIRRSLPVNAWDVRPDYAEMDFHKKAA